LAFLFVVNQQIPCFLFFEFNTKLSGFIVV